MVTRFGGRLQLDLDAAPGRRGEHRLLGGRQLNGLLTHLPGLCWHGFAPGAGLVQLRVPGVLTHDKARLALLPALQQGAGAEVAVGDPHLALLGLLQQGGRAYALALVRVLAGQDVRDY